MRIGKGAKGVGLTSMRGRLGAGDDTVESRGGYITSFRIRVGGRVTSVQTRPVARRGIESRTWSVWCVRRRWSGSVVTAHLCR